MRPSGRRTTQSFRFDSGQTVRVMPSCDQPRDQRRRPPARGCRGRCGRRAACPAPPRRRRAGLPRRRGPRRFRPVVAAACEHPGELRRRVADLGGVQARRRRSGPDTARPASGVAKAASSSRWRRKQRISLEVTPERRLRLLHAGQQAVDHHARTARRGRCGSADRRTSPRGVQPSAATRAEIGHGQVVEVGLGRAAPRRPGNRCPGSPAGCEKA